MASLHTIRPAEGFPPRIGLFLAQLVDVRERTKASVEGLNSGQLCWHPQPDVESIGTLLLHIAAVECSWIQEDIARQPMGEEWMIAFPIRFGLPQIADRDVKYFMEKLDAVRDETRRVLAGLTDDDLARAIVPLDDANKPNPPQYTIEWILHHLIEHEAHHKGQIAVMKRLLPERAA